MSNDENNVEDVESTPVEATEVVYTGNNQLATTNNNVQVNNDEDDMSESMLQKLIDSKVLPGNVKTIAHAFAYAKYGNELGFKVMQSFHNLVMINGRLGLNANGMQALATKAGIVVEVVYDAGYLYADGKIEDFPRETDEKIIDRVTMLLFKRKMGEFGVVTQKVTFTFRDAKRADLVDKDVWKKWLRNMLFAAAYRIGVRRIANDVIGGLYTAEELADMAGNEAMIIRDNEGMVIGERTK